MPFIAELFRTESVYQLKAKADKKGLRKALGAFDITLMGIGAIIGAGIFVLVALIYSELASMVPLAGST